MKKIHEILTHRKRICKIRIHRMTAPGLAACLVFMAVSLAACQSADSGTGGQKENIAAVREQDGAGESCRKRRKRPGHRDTPGAGSCTGYTGYGSRTGDSRGAAGGGRFDDSGPVADGSWIRHMQKGRTSPVCIGHGRKPDENR